MTASANYCISFGSLEHEMNSFKPVKRYRVDDPDHFKLDSHSFDFQSRVLHGGELLR